MSQAQIVDNACIRIDFESVLGEEPISGMSLGNQYFASTGISFSLENGAIPVLAGLGPPLEAFAGPTGPDSSPDEAILGNFMLTDDGLLGSSNFSPLVISFSNPIDSLSAVILDLDGDEFFDIMAFDETGQLIYENTIRAGDPMTGDGRATPFGFNLDECEASVYSVSFSGMRNDGGGFGLAMDNFVFCFEGVDLLKDLEVNVTNIICQDNPGEIEIINNGDLNLEFSIDGNNFVEDGFFTDLTVGEYVILVRDDNGCEAILNAVVEADGPTIIEELIVTHTSCGETNGSFEVIATQETGVIYFIDAFDLSNDNIFTDLEPGTYPITVIGPSGCSASQMVTINPSVPLFLDGLEAEDDSCQKTIGAISVITTGGTGQLSYSLNDGLTFQNESVFDSLTAGFYEVFLQDESLCSFSDTISVSDTPGIEISTIQVTESICEIPSGSIQFSVQGGVGELEYQINDGQFQSISNFTDLGPGEYNIKIQDEIGCEWDAFAEIPSPICPIYIPNTFNPLATDENGTFRLFTLSGQEVEILSYEIFDRWGSRIYSAYNFPIHSEGNWWEGRTDGIKWASGVYVYRIEVQFFNGDQDVYTGDISLIR